MKKYNLQQVNDDIGKYGKSITILAGILLLNGIALHHIIKNGNLISGLDELIKEKMKNNEPINNDIFIKLQKSLKLNTDKMNSLIEKISNEYKSNINKPLDLIKSDQSGTNQFGPLKIYNNFFKGLYQHQNNK